MVVGFGRLKVTHLVIVIAVVIGVARSAEISKSRYGFWSRWVFGCIGVQRLRLVLVSVPQPNQANAADCQSGVFLLWVLPVVLSRIGGSSVVEVNLLLAE